MSWVGGSFLDPDYCVRDFTWSHRYAPLAWGPAQKMTFFQMVPFSLLSVPALRGVKIIPQIIFQNNWLEPARWVRYLKLKFGDLWLEKDSDFASFSLACHCLWYTDGLLSSLSSQVSSNRCEQDILNSLRTILGCMGTLFGLWSRQTTTTTQNYAICYCHLRGN